MTSLTESDSDADYLEHLDAYARERLAPHREHLERLAMLDTALSEDAKKALQMLDEAERGELPDEREEVRE
ncbi:hypothetical protein [Halomarina ordinaria]|uniref:Uncharacterized protein n=1 Tax=Halomarina ordinaria TaxID=3033939 RepID=A0ABD5U9I6_9EURY|nr:hypothetical protein [Halomarina sp. PSRA2]